MAFKAIIADDEKHICALITHLVDWVKLDIQLVGVVHTGADALELILKEQPQIVISDIRMPGYDGIELTRRTIEAGLDTKFILISGHRQFDYAHQAIQYGVVDYILKPIQKDSLEAALQKAIAEIRTVQEGKSNQQAIQHLMTRDRHQQARDTLATLILAPRVQQHLTIDALNNQYDLHFTTPVQVLAYELPNAADGGESNNPILEDKINQAWQKFIADYTTEAILMKAGSIHYVVMTSGDPDKQPSFEYLLETCNQTLRLFDQVQISIGLSGSDSLDADPVELARQAESAMRQQLLQGSGKVITYRPAYASSSLASPLIRPETSINLKKQILELDQQAVSFEINKIFADLGRLPQVHATQFLDTIQAILSLLNNAISALEAENRIYLDRHQVAQALRWCNSFSCGQKAFEALVRGHLQQLQNNRQQLSLRPVQIARQIIVERYAEALSLNEIAEQVHLSPVYLSVLFKKETGENFKEFVMNHRIEVAKSRLRETEENVKDIAESVGYHDLKHFRAVFQKIVGLGPNQYRKLYKRMSAT